MASATTQNQATASGPSDGVQIPAHMRAWTHSRGGAPGTVLQLTNEKATPAKPTGNNLLIKVSHCALHPGASLLMCLVPMIFRKKPATAETDFAGVVIAVGKEGESSSTEDADRHFQPGSEVFGSLEVPDHLKTGQGALSEYLLVKPSAVASKPSNMSLADAAGLPVSGGTALALFDAAALKPGQKVLINACCGGIGHYTTQLVRNAIGNTGKIIGVCSAANAEVAKKLGCDETIDHHTEKDGKTLNQRLAEAHAGGNAFDCIIDCHGSQLLWHGCAGFLKPANPYVSVGPKFTSMSALGALATLPQMVLNMLTPTWLGGVPRPYRQVTAFADTKVLERLRKLAGDEAVLRTEIGGSFEMKDALRAYEALLGGHARGKIVVQVAQGA